MPKHRSVYASYAGKGSVNRRSASGEKNVDEVCELLMEVLPTNSSNRKTLIKQRDWSLSFSYLETNRADNKSHSRYFH